MDGVNLLPWREENRRTQDRQMFIFAIAVWVLCVVAVFGAHNYSQVLKDNQKKRNEYLTIEIGKLDAKIKEINKLKVQKDNLIARMEVIQNLQRQRTQVVHLFDDIVRKLPEGVYFTTMKKKGKEFDFTGIAQSNARVSNLMGRFDSSEWFTDPDLKVINVTPSQGVRLSEFNLKVSQETKKNADG